MPPNRRHRAGSVAGRAVGARLRRWARASGAGGVAVPPGPWPGRGALAGGIACAAVIGGVVSKTTAVTLAAIVATAGAGAAAALLIRLALRIHGRAHTFGPCRGAGYLGLGSAIAAAAAATGGVLAATSGDQAATVAVQMGTGLAATSFTAGLLLLPGAAPTIGERLRQCLDCAAIGCAVFLVAWLLVLTPHSGPRAGTHVLVGLIASVAIAIAVITGLRAAQHRPAAFACAAGVSLAIAGLALPALGRHEPAWLLAAGFALVVGPPLMIFRASRADSVPAGFAAAAWRPNRCSPFRWRRPSAPPRTRRSRWAASTTSRGRSGWSWRSR